MQLLICMLLGAVVAWAMKPRNETNTLGWWRPIAGAVAASLPYVDYFLLFAPENIQQAYMQGLTWSLILAPILAMASALVFAILARGSWHDFSRISILAYLVSLLLAVMTTRGVPIFAPFTYWRAALDILHPFDWGIFSIFTMVVLLCCFIRGYQRDIARAGLALTVVYITVVVTFSNKAQKFGEEYAEAFGLSVVHVYALPQPISPLNWRVMVETEDQRLHDTLINLGNKEIEETDKHSNRAARIASLYKPMDMAVWRVYHRFGHKDKAFSKSAFVSMYKASDQFQFLSRFWVAKDVILYNSNKCARFIDLRREGSRNTQGNMFMICNENGGAALYRSDEEGHFSLFEMMY